ncbi:flagellar hook-basal body protein [Sphingomonas koreensis]
MGDAFEVGAIAMRTQQRALEILANNIANVNTQGFKRTQVRYADIVSNRLDAQSVAEDRATPPAFAGVTMDPRLALDEQGDVQRTGRLMDLAIEGAGFIELMGPAGQTLLWRGGGLKILDDGMLATEGGIPLKAAVSLPRDAVELSIDKNGTVRVKVGSEAEAIEIGQIRLTRLDDASGVERLDGGLYRVEEARLLNNAEPGEDGVGFLVQGALERSNVELTNEMVQLIMVQRAYAASAQVVQAADQLMGIVNGLRR